MDKSAIKRMIDLSTSHVTKEDASLVGQTFGSPDMPRVTVHQYGWIVFVNSTDAPAQVEAMKAAGYSDAYTSIYREAAQLGGDLMLINFDQDAEVVEGLPTFDW